jgi:hypothetical protein
MEQVANFGILVNIAPLSLDVDDEFLLLWSIFPSSQYSADLLASLHKKLIYKPEAI